MHTCSQYYNWYPSILPVNSHTQVMIIIWVSSVRVAAHLHLPSGRISVHMCDRNPLSLAKRCKHYKSLSRLSTMKLAIGNDALLFWICVRIFSSSCNFLPLFASRTFLFFCKHRIGFTQRHLIVMRYQNGHKAGDSVSVNNSSKLFNFWASVQKNRF